MINTNGTPKRPGYFLIVLLSGVSFHGFEGNTAMAQNSALNDDSEPGGENGVGARTDASARICRHIFSAQFIGFNLL